MKKLLSLLSVLTISGTAVPTTIAASNYEKVETKLENSDIDYQQTNNLKKLNREKRNNNLQPSQLCSKPTLAAFTAGGAAAGASIGSIVPGAGTVIGLGLGSVVGIGTGLWAGYNFCPKV